MKKTIFILSILLVSIYACETDYDAEDQGIILQDLPNYVAFSVDGTVNTIAPVEVSESSGDTGSDINVEIIGGTLSDVTVNYTFEGTAVFGTDFTIDGATSSGGSVVIEYNNAPNIDGLPFNADIVVEILEDGVADGEKTLDIVLASATNANGEIAVGRGGTEALKVATVIISEDDYITFSSESAQVNESEDSVILEVEAYPGATRTSDITVGYTLGGTAIYGVDYTIAGGTATGGTFIILAPATPPEEGGPVVFELEVEILTDSVEDGEKTIEITLDTADDGSPLSIGVGGGDTGTTSIITINDSANTVSFIGIMDLEETEEVEDAIYADETDGSAFVTFELHVGSEDLSDVTVAYSLSGTAVFGTDYNIIGATEEGGSVVITPDDPSTGSPTTLDLEVEILTDYISDGSKEIIITIDEATVTSTTDVSVGINNTVSIEITDADFVSFDVDSLEVEVDEDAGSVSVTLEALTETEDINLNYSLGGTAVYGTDYLIDGATSSGGTLTITPSGSMGVKSTVDLDIIILTDETVDGDKTIEITVDSASQGNGTPFTIIDGVSTITIADIDM